jgi:hypothetical protein
MYIWVWKTPGVGISGEGPHGQVREMKGVSLRATRVRGGQILSQQGPSKWKGTNKGSKGIIMYIAYLARVYNGMIAVVYICVIIIIGMNVIDNLNSVCVINKPCMSSRNMCLLPRATLHSDSEQYCSSGYYIFAA